MVRAGALMKIEFVLEVARKDPRFLNDLYVDPFRTLDQSGIDLSRGEVTALIDIVKGTSFSTLAPYLRRQRDQWHAVLQDEGARFTAEATQPEGDTP
jgi:hypothetical protein